MGSEVFHGQDKRWHIPPVPPVTLVNKCDWWLVQPAVGVSVRLSRPELPCAAFRSCEKDETWDKKGRRRQVQRVEANRTKVHFCFFWNIPTRRNLPPAEFVCVCICFFLCCLWLNQMLEKKVEGLSRTASCAVSAGKLQLGSRKKPLTFAAKRS